MDTKEYLGQIKNLEILAYEQKYLCNKIQYAIKKLHNTSYEKAKQNLAEPSVMTLKQIGKILGIPIGIGLIVIIVLNSLYGGMEKVGIVYGYCLLMFAIVPLIIVACEYRKREEKIEAVKQQNKKINEQNQTILKKNEIIKQRVAQKERFLLAEYNEISHNYSLTSECLKKLYSKDIIHPKYRNMIAVCSLYEYFDTKRCTALTGHEGAYNIYENEMRLNHIIGQMDVVIKNLEQIKNNQYELYCALSESNRKLGYINNNLDNILSVTNDVAESVALTEYNSQIAAQNTEVIKWIDILDHF